MFVKYLAKVSAFVRALTTLPCSSLSFNDLAVCSFLVLLIQTTTATRGVGGSGEALKSRRSGEATSAAVSDHQSKSHSKSLEVVRLLLGPPSPNRETLLFTTLSAENATLPSRRKGVSASMANRRPVPLLLANNGVREESA